MSDNKYSVGSCKAFSINLKNLRKSMGLTQAELGKALNVQKSCISNYEQGFSMPDVNRLVKIADYFLVDLGYLLGHSPQMSIRENGNNNRRVSIVDTVEFQQEPLRSEHIIDELTLPAINLKSGNFFGIQIPDNSMSRSKLKKGDVAVIRRQPVSTGDIVLFVVEGGKPMIRKLYIMDDIFSFMPDSDDNGYFPIQLNSKTDKFEVFGKLHMVHLTF